MGYHKELSSSMCKACCCLSFLLIINCWLLLHLSGEVGMISWVLWSGEYQTDGDTYLFVPGGGNALCNDLCVTLCVYDDTQCEVTNCLNTCANQLIEDGNMNVMRYNYTDPSKRGDDFLLVEGGFEIDIEIEIWEEPFATTEELLPIGADVIYEDYDTESDVDTDSVIEVDTPPMVPPPENGDMADDEVMINEDAQPEDGSTGNPKLDQLRSLILTMADNINTLKTEYETDCSTVEDTDDCVALHNKIDNLIVMFEAFVQSWNNVAIEFNLEITVSVWLDVAVITTSP